MVMLYPMVCSRSSFCIPSLFFLASVSVSIFWCYGCEDQSTLILSQSNKYCNGACNGFEWAVIIGHSVLRERSLDWNKYERFTRKKPLYFLTEIDTRRLNVNSSVCKERPATQWQFSNEHHSKWLEKDCQALIYICFFSVNCFHSIYSVMLSNWSTLSHVYQSLAKNKHQKRKKLKCFIKFHITLDWI